MGKKITAYKVTNLNKVDTTLYIDGDHFYTDKTIGILVNGKVKTIGNTPPNLKDYVKKNEITDFITKEDIPDIPDLTDYAKKEDIPDIPDVSSFLNAEEVQKMIDEALDTGGE